MTKQGLLDHGAIMRCSLLCDKACVAVTVEDIECSMAKQRGFYKFPDLVLHMQASFIPIPLIEAERLISLANVDSSLL